MVSETDERLKQLMKKHANEIRYMDYIAISMTIVGAVLCCMGI